MLRQELGNGFCGQVDLQLTVDNPQDQAIVSSASEIDPHTLPQILTDQPLYELCQGIGTARFGLFPDLFRRNDLVW
jgi:hypothetical protein